MCGCRQNNITLDNYSLSIIKTINNFFEIQRKSYIKNGLFTDNIDWLGEDKSGYFTHLYMGKNVVFMSLVGARPNNIQFRMYIILYKLIKSNGEELLESLILNDIGILLDDIEVIDECVREPLYFEGYSVINESELTQNNLVLK